MSLPAPLPAWPKPLPPLPAPLLLRRRREWMFGRRALAKRLLAVATALAARIAQHAGIRLAALLALLAAASASAGPALACPELIKLKLPQAQIHFAQQVAQGEPLVLWAGGAPVAMARSFCLVRGTARPVPGSHIGFEVWLPLAGEWNGKFLQAGNGGFAGSVPLPALHDAVARGYAAAATDGGHQHPDGLSAAWALGQPQRVVDFGWRAVRQTTLAAQRILARAYGRAPRKAYFVGCSNGGRDALMVAQRFAGDFDGIVAGAPAAHWTELMVAGALVHRDFAPPRSVLPRHKLAALQAAARAACAAGGAFIADPQACAFDPQLLACTGQDTPECLSPEQVQAVRSVYQGPLDPTTGQHLSGLAPGAEAEPGNWDFWLLLQAGQGPGDKPVTDIAESFFRYIVRGDAGFSLAELNNADVQRARARWAGTLDAVNPDLRTLRQRGTKLLQYHGWSDAAIPPLHSLRYRHAVQQRLGDSASFHRLFMVPGMNHCGGGSGPWQVDWLHALERWVEQGQAPQDLLATHPSNTQTQVLRAYQAP